MESMAAREGASSARRRRDRQLRAWHRHVQRTVAMELATALHHSFQRPKERVVEEPREEELAEQHNATSGQNATPPWGVRSPHPLDVSAQPPLVAATCVAAGVPVLNAPSLGGGADGVDGATVRFLLVQSQLERQKQEAAEKRREEERKKVELEKAKAAEKEEEAMLRPNRRVQHDHAAWRRWIGLPPTAASSSSRPEGGKRRKTKKKRKRRGRRTTTRTCS